MAQGLVDRLDLALRFAKLAIDTFVGVDTQKVGPFIKAIDGAYFDAIAVFAVDADVCNDVGHWKALLFYFCGHEIYRRIAGIARQTGFLFA